MCLVLRYRVLELLDAVHRHLADVPHLLLRLEQQGKVTQIDITSDADGTLTHSTI